MISLLIFHLADGVAEADFLEADKRMQEDFSYQQPGLLRRTTAVNDQRDWLVLELWSSPEAASAAEANMTDDDVAQAFMGCVDQTTVRTARFAERR